MGTIAEKLTYLNTTKTMLRDSLNKFGSNILSTDTFRSYDTKLNDIYDKLPKVTQSGAGFTLSNVQNGQVDDFKMNGVDLEQDTTTGKNLLNTNNIVTGALNGVTTSYNAETQEITLNGTCTTNNTQVRISTDPIDFTSGVTKMIAYYVSGSVDVSSTTDNRLLFRTFRGGGQWDLYAGVNIATLNSSNPIVSITGNSTGTKSLIDLRFDKNTVLTNFKIKLMITDSDNTDFEKFTFGASPNPDYPQDIKVVEGRQVITDKGKNLFDVSQTPHSNSLPGAGVITTLNNDGTISTSGTNTETYRNIRYDIQLPAGEYIISGCPAGGSKNGYSSLVQLTEETSSQIFDTGSGATFTLTETTTVKFYPVRVGSETVNFNGLIFKPMIRLSNISNDTFESYYEPVEYNIDLNLENIYLAKISDTNYKNRIYKNNGNWYYEKNVEKVILDGSEEWGYGSISGVFYTTSITNYAISNNVPYSNYYKGVSNVSGASNMGQQSNNTIGFINVSGQTTPRFYIKDTKYTNNTPDLKTWLSTHNLEVWYALATPVTTQITNTTLINQLEAISVHTGTNIITISNSNNIIPEIEITRLKELEKLS